MLDQDQWRLSLAFGQKSGERFQLDWAFDVCAAQQHPADAALLQRIGHAFRSIFRGAAPLKGDDEQRAERFRKAILNRSAGSQRLL